jgi:uncharacterized protein YdhG (YjbR/CyaY superfamily)
MAMRSSARTIDEYLSEFPTRTRKALQQIRRLIRAAAPDATETISYAIPTFDLDGRHLVHFAGYDRHVGFYPTGSGIDAFTKELAGYTQGKGSVQFPLDQPLPAELIRRIVEFRVNAEEARKAAKRIRPTRAARSSRAGAPPADDVEFRIAGFLEKYSPPVAAAARACRTRLRALVPRGCEFVYDNYNALVFGFGPSEKPSTAVLSIAVFPDWVTLCFLKGASLEDPDGLLKGSGNQVRHVRLAAPADLDRPEVRRLIGSALEPVAHEIAKAAPLHTVIRPVSAKQRPRRPRGG